MSDRKPLADHETVMLALDQVSQTIEVLNKVVKRLRRHLEDQQRSTNTDKPVAEPEDQTLH